MMIKLIAIIIFFLINFVLNRSRKRKYPEFKRFKVNSIKRYIVVGLLLGIVTGLAGAYKLTHYPNFDKNFDLFLIGWMILFLIIDESIEFLIINGKGNWFLIKKGKV